MNHLPTRLALSHPSRRRDYRRVRVSSVSLEGLREGYGDGFEPVADGFAVLFQDQTDLYKALTKRQREVARLLAKGYTRKEVAAKRGTGVQTVHQMVLVMRKRIRAYMEKQSVA